MVCGHCFSDDCEVGSYLPPAAVSIDVGRDSAPVGIFSRYRTLTLRLSDRFGSLRLWAQDLAGDRATDITSRIASKSREIAISGDCSDPGLVR